MIVQAKARVIKANTRPMASLRPCHHTKQHHSMSNTSPSIITHEALETLSGKAQTVARLRANLNVHPQLEDPIQRLFNAMEPGTYVRPHRHARKNGWELMMCIKGAFSILLFDDSGTVLNRIDLASDSGNLAVEIPAFAWHIVVSHRPGTVMFEVKPGPYTVVDDKDFAAWAPPEFDPSTERFRLWYATAQAGDQAPPWKPDSV